MRALTIVLACLVMSGSTSLAEAQSDVPRPVAAGLAELEAGRCDAAFQAWSPRGAASGNAVQRLTDCAALRRLGALHGHELLRVIGVGARIRRIYLVLRYETQPVYLLLVAYQPADEWSVIRTSWSTDADRVLPASMVPPERREP